MLPKRYRCLGAGMLVPLITVAAWAGVHTDGAQAQSAGDQPNTPKGALKARQAADKAQRRGFDHTNYPDQIVLKFVEGSRVRLRSGKLTQSDDTLSARDTERLTRRGLSSAAIPALLRGTSALLGDPSVSVARLFERPERDLEADQSAGEAASGEELADLNLYYTVRVAPENAQALLDALNESDAVEIAYPSPLPVQTPATDIAPATPSLVDRQGYLEGAPTGIDARYGWTRAGGNGANVRIVDVEYSWNTQHEDLGAGGTNTPAVSLRSTNGCEPPCTVVGGVLTCTGTNFHGTAVLGVLRAQNNAYGMTGIAHGSTYGIVGQYQSSAPCANFNTAAAINAAAAAPTTQAGDIILIEAQAGGPATCPQTVAPPCGWNTAPSPGVPAVCSNQYGSVPVEWNQAEFDAIRAATTNGRIVVEAAGNGEQNLDAAIYNNRFNRATRDSGAIIVGAGSSTTLQPRCFTDFGSRVDVQGWGENVATLSYGVLQYNGAAQDQWYTPSFGGTSSASAVVAGATAVLQGIRRAAGQPVFTPAQMRAQLLLRATPQPTPVTSAIGPLPNLRGILSPAQPIPTGTLAALRQSTNTTSTMAVGGDGALYLRSVGTSGVWTSPDARTSTGFIPVHAGVAMGKRTSSEANAFVVANDGRIYTLKSTNDGAWTSPTSITAANFAPPGAPLAISNSASNAIEVFVVGTDGALKVLSNSGGSWSAPYSITGAGVVPTSAALSTTLVSGFITVLYVGFDGAVTQAWWDGFFWNAPEQISDVGFYVPGSPVGAGYVGGTSALFAVGWDGAISMFLDETFWWSTPTAITAANILPPGAAVGVANYGGINRVELFYVDTTGTLRTQTSTGSGWTTTAMTAANVAAPGIKTAAATRSTNQLIMFANMHSGLVRSTTTNGTSWGSLITMP